MRALALTETGLSLHDHWPVPAPGPDEVLVRVLRAGICETDLQLVRGYMGFTGVLGHEFVGIAESGPFAGRRVGGEINCSCRRCATCLAGRHTHCPHRTTIGIAGHDGAFADLVAVPQRNLHIVPDAVSTDAAVFVEPLAAAFQVPAQLMIRPGDRVVVLGDGRLGNLCAQVLWPFTRNLLVVGKHTEKLAHLQSMAIPTSMLSEAPLDHGADVVVDCTGSDTGLPTALKLVRPRGTIVLKTTRATAPRGGAPGGAALNAIVVNEITVLGSRCGPFDTALAALESGSIHVLPLISERFDLSRGVEAFDCAAAPGVMKVLIDIASA
jgi:threonine dehydrogenase-like Zn-dependent dehydrogenase